MVKISEEKLKQLQKQSSQIRNICILAHVDHGKTTLADSLIASNEIISQKLAGQLRYLDSRPDEQERQITMKCSSISLYYKSVKDMEYLVNLIDSPGHVDFSSEVSTAIRLCDGCVIVVDSVEGVCAQTRICLQQAYNENLKPILFINKIDRLILEMDMSPSDAYKRLTQILEQVNAVLGNIFASDIISKESANENHQSALEDADDSNLYFDPVKGNVIFGSALDNWGFTTDAFTGIYASKLGLSEAELQKSLWGDYFYSQNKKRIESNATEKGRKPLFVSLILEPIWKMYTIAKEKQANEFETTISKLGFKLTKRDLNFVDPKVPIKAFFSQWLPLYKHILEMVSKHVPSPDNISESKVLKLISSDADHIKTLPAETQLLKTALAKCDPSSVQTIAFVSKMFAVDAKTVMDFRDLSIEERQNQSEEIFIAFSRVFSGTLRTNDTVLVLGPKHNPNRITMENHLESPYITKVQIKQLYLLMGRNMEVVDEVPAGNIAGIGGLENIVFKTATLSTNPFCPAFVDLPAIATPILRVAVEPKNLQDMPRLVSGLKLLNQADPCVQVLVQESGEHVLLTLGEVHLERCIKDLQETFAKVEINVSKPIVPFRETIVKYVPPEDAIPEKPKSIEEQRVVMHTANKLCQISIRAAPLPSELTELLEKNSDISRLEQDSENVSKLTTTVRQRLDEMKKSIEKALLGNKLNIPFSGLSQIWSLAPRKCATNILLNCTDYKNTSAFQTKINKAQQDDVRANFDSSFINGFQLATQCGPICEEPMQGVCFIVEDWEINVSDSDTSNHTYGPFSGQIMSVVKEACKKAFQIQPQRLVTPMYTCTIIVDINVLNKLYAVIGKRNGQIVSADLIEGSGQFSVTAHLPVIESFNFAKQIRTETSGLAAPQLVFSHWEIFDLDPYWVPTTKEEQEQYGDKADVENTAKLYMDSVRERKGLSVEKKTIEHAEKQRTLSKNK